MKKITIINGYYNECTHKQKKKKMKKYVVTVEYMNILQCIEFQCNLAI